MHALDALSDAQADGLAAGLASLSSLTSLSIGAHGRGPLTRPAAVASRLSLLLPRLTSLESLWLTGFGALAGQPPVRPPPSCLLASSLPPPAVACLKLPPSWRSAS
jgi:hypothetical protein